MMIALPAALDASETTQHATDLLLAVVSRLEHDHHVRQRSVGDVAVIMSMMSALAVLPAPPIDGVIRPETGHHVEPAYRCP
jgi:hypothetical protein